MDTSFKSTENQSPKLAPPVAAAMAKPGFLNFSRLDWTKYFTEKKIPGFRATQAADWIFKHFVTSPDQMSNVSKDLRASLEKDFDWNFLKS